MATTGIIELLRPNRLERAVLDIVERVSDESDLPALLEIYVRRSGIDRDRFTEPIRAAMIRHLQERGAQLSENGVNNGDFDGLFALAYDYAVETTSGADDPIDAAHQPGGGPGTAAWDFSVDTFEQVEQQGIVRDNILAAGAIDYVYELGERLGVFRLLDALVLNWASGKIDVASGPAVSRLYRYWKLRDRRASPEERGMLYRRVLDKGTTEVLSRMVTNEPFPQLWHNLMQEVADYIDKTERVSEGFGASSPVSRSRIHQATRELQYNLTDACTGMAHVQVRELYAQLQECFEILGDPEILAHFGGNRRKSQWTVIEQLSRQELGVAPNIGAHRSLAVDGNTIYRWIADYQNGGLGQDRFEALLRSSESYILNYSSVGEAPAGEKQDEDEEKDAEPDDF